MSQSDMLIDSRQEYFSGATSKFATETPHQKFTKVVAFESPPRDVARCSSPTWEAYERRKIEKKMEKERDEPRRDGPRRLSKKPPPPSSPKYFQHALASEPDASRGRGRERAESTAATSGSSQGNNRPCRKARSRSGSFVSMLRAPFEFRRLSTGQMDAAPNDLGFIGGIKLELQRHADQQQNLSRSAVEDESEVHPALRKTNQDLDHQPPPLVIRPRTAGGWDQRRYPPITRANNNHHHHHQSTACPTTMSPAAPPATPDVGQIDKWRNRMGLRAGSRPRSRAGPDEVSQFRGSEEISNGCKQQEQGTLVTRGPWQHTPHSPGRPSSEPAAHVPTFAGDELKKQSDENGHPQKHSNNESVSSTSSAATEYKTAPSSPPPPEPPQRSSRRNSALTSVEPIRPLSTPTQQQQQQQQQQTEQHDADTRSAAAAAAAAKDTKPFVFQRSFPLRKNGAKPIGKQSGHEWGGGAPSSVAGQMSMGHPLSSPSSSHNGNLPTSSSEDSCDDDLRSSSAISTPATSRPQSEREMPLTCSEEDKPASVHDAVRVCFRKTYPLLSAENSEDEAGFDPIQAAAEKVLAVFNDIPVQRSGLLSHARSSSQTSLAIDTDASFEPSARERPLNLGAKKKSTDPVPVQKNSSPAACYLEQARKQPPAAAPARGHTKLRLGPPASFVLPADESGAVKDRTRPALTAHEPLGRHVRRKSTPLLAATGRDAVAKIFVECCSCQRYHDMPDNLYKAMSDPEGILSSADKCGYTGALSMTVRCSWCKHEMSVRCCSAFSTAVYIQERLR